MNGRCPRCGERVIWARVPTGSRFGARLAVDVERQPHGRIQLVYLKLSDEPEARRLSAHELKELRTQQTLAHLAGIDDEHELRLYVAHDSTCAGLKRANAA